MPLVSEVVPGAGPKMTDRLFRTSCHHCGTEQLLSEASVDQTDDWETVYSCREGCGPILVVGTHGAVPWEGRGFRFGDWLVRNRSDLYLFPPGKDGAVLIPASPDALD